MAMTIQTVTKEELQAKLRAGTADVINVLEPDHYKLGMIKGTRRLPGSQIEKRQRELDKNREVITYCASPECPASMNAAEKLASLGYNVRAYEGGIKEWKEAGLPMD